MNYTKQDIILGLSSNTKKYKISINKKEFYFTKGHLVLKDYPIEKTLIIGLDDTLVTDIEIRYK